MATKAPTPTLGSSSGAAEERYAHSELLLIINSEPVLTIKAVDKNGVLVPNFSITTPYGSLPALMGFTVIGSKLHMIGGFTKKRDKSTVPFSLDTYVLDVHNIPRALASGDDLSLHLATGPRLNSSKISPVLYVVKDYIYALSSGIHGRYSASSDFEFRHKDDLAWTKLPNPPVPADVGFHGNVESHALVDDKSIVISLADGMGAYVFNLASRSWATLEDPVGFTGNPIYRYGFCYAPSGDALKVFRDGSWSSPVHELKIRETSPCVGFWTIHGIAVMGDVTFIVRCGSPVELSKKGCNNPVYITIDRYKVSRIWDDEERCCKHSITGLSYSDPLLLKKDDPFGGASAWPYFLTVSLSG